MCCVLSKRIIKGQSKTCYRLPTTVAGGKISSSLLIICDLYRHLWRNFNIHRTFPLVCLYSGKRFFRSFNLITEWFFGEPITAKKTKQKKNIFKSLLRKKVPAFGRGWMLLHEIHPHTINWTFPAINPYK